MRTVSELRKELEALELLGCGDYPVCIPVRDVGNVSLVSTKLVEPDDFEEKCFLILEHEEMN